MVVGDFAPARRPVAQRTGRRVFAFYIAVLGLLAAAVLALAMDDPGSARELSGSATQANAAHTDRASSQQEGLGRELMVGAIAGTGMLGAAGGVIWYAARGRGQHD